MNKALFAAIVASTFGLGAISAFGADMTNDERSELRQRADRLLAERAPGTRTCDPMSGLTGRAATSAWTGNGATSR